VKEIRAYLRQSMIKGWLSREVNVYDLSRLWWGLRPIKMDDNSLTRLTDRRIFETEEEVDGSTIRLFNEALLDATIARIFTVNEPVYFGTQVVMENATAVPGLAAQGGRVAIHEGFDLVGTIDGKAQLSQTEILFSSEELQRSSAGKRLIKIYKPTVIRVMDLSEYRSDVVVRLGADKRGRQI
jgi:hypothetical protein